MKKEAVDLDSLGIAARELLKKHNAKSEAPRK